MTKVGKGIVSTRGRNSVMIHFKLKTKKLLDNNTNNTFYLSVLKAASSDENPDLSLPKNSRFAFKNGEMREVQTSVKPTELLVTGQTKSEAFGKIKH